MVEPNLIFYDTETTGTDINFSQIIQCGSVLTDAQLNIKDEQNIGSSPLPWVIPHPKAMLTNKKINSFKSNSSHYQIDQRYLQSVAKLEYKSTLNICDLQWTSF